MAEVVQEVGYSPTYKEYNSRNIFEKITSRTALFLCVDALDFNSRTTGEPNPKMKVRCCNYDVDKPVGERIINEIDSYIPISKFLLLCHDVLNGTAYKRKTLLAKAKDSLEYKNAVYFQNYGGSYGPPVTATRFALVNGAGGEGFAFLASSGPGKTTKAGAILPLSKNEGGTAPTTVFVNLSNDDLKEFCLIGKAYIEQFIGLDLTSRLRIVREQRANYVATRERP